MVNASGEGRSPETADQAVRPLLAILILNWNSRENTLECLDSLERVSYPKDRLGLFIVDNGSQDDSVPVLRERLDKLRGQGWRDLLLVENGENLGFARGNNTGYDHIPAEYGLVYLSNDDIVFFEDCLERVADAFDAHPRTGVVGAKVLTYDSPHTLSHGAGYVRPLLLGTRTEDSDSLKACDFVTGCALCIRREVVEALGTLFDPAFFAYWEDTDLCTRVRLVGYEVLYCPQARVLHKVSAATGGAEGLVTPSRAYYIMHGKTLFARRHLSWPSRWLFYLLFGARFPWFVVRTAFQGGLRASALWKAYVRGIRDALAARSSN